MAKHDRLVEDLSDRYLIERELGRGGMAVVYLAQDQRLDRQVAIKVMRTAPDADDETFPRLLREARTVGKLQHPKIVQIYDVRTLEDDGLALIMLYVPGLNLKQMVRREGPLAPTRAAEILVDVAEALQYAHERRLVHRDVKPENIHIQSETGTALLSDFGIARPWGASSTLTMQGAALGTPAYMSPEQIDGLELDGRTDVYSLGLVGYEILAGKAPFAGDTLFRVLEKQKREMPPPLTTVRDDLPDELILAIEKATQKDREDRWSSAKDFADRVRAAALPEYETPRPASPAPRHAVDVSEDAPTILFRRDSDTGEPVVAGGSSTPNPVGSRKRAIPRPSIADVIGTPDVVTPRPVEPSTPPARIRIAADLDGDLRSFVAVESDLDFRNVMDLDPFLHCETGDVRLTHLKCGGVLVVEPPQFERTRRGKLRPAPTGQEEEVWLVCGTCDDRTEGIPRAELETALKKFLSRPIPSALDAYPLGRGSKLVSADWLPPRRRRNPDRRTSEGRYDQDPSLLGKRRLGRDRRRTPGELDILPGDEDGEGTE